MRGLLFIGLWLAFQSLSAQHCGWDFRAVILLDLRDSAGNVIPDLELTLLDTNRLPIVSLNQFQAEERRDTLLFEQTREYASFFRGKDLAQPQMQWPYKERIYSCMLYGQDNPLKHNVSQLAVHIRDTDGSGKGGDFGERILPLQKEDVFIFCPSYRYNADKPRKIVLAQ